MVLKPITHFCVTTAKHWGCLMKQFSLVLGALGRRKPLSTMDFNAMMSHFKEAASKPLPQPPQTGRANNSAADAPTVDSSLPRSKRPKISHLDDRGMAKIVHLPPVRHIYMVCPAGAQTGGPEALHQLCDMINCVNGKTKETAGGCTAFMIYARELLPRRDGAAGEIRIAEHARTPDPYKQYNAPVVPELPKASSDLVVWPECWTHLIDAIPSTQAAIWWLSVDNNKRNFRDFGRSDIRHLVQSEYARDYLIQNDVPASNVVSLKEYIPTARFPDKEELHFVAAKRDLDVVYNPSKGMHFTDEIIDRSRRSGIRFTPIGGGSNASRLSPIEVSRLLLRAKVYIDFGPHPGMDRLPREAALCGCIVITNRNGAAAFEEDVPIPDEYKIGEKSGKFDVDKVYDVLKPSVDEYDTRCHDFDEYRTWIGKQKDTMRSMVEDMVSKVQQMTTTDSGNDEANASRNTGT